MAGRTETSQPTFDETCAYVATVKKAFQEEPAKFEEFTKLLRDYRFERIDIHSLVTSMEGLMGSYSELFAGFSVFHTPASTSTTKPPKAKRTIRPEAKKTAAPVVNETVPPETNGTIGGSSELTMDDSRAYIAAVKEAFKGEPEKYKEFVQILSHVYTHREDEAYFVGRVKELMKDHPNLLRSFNAFFPTGSPTTIPPAAKTTNRTIPVEPIRAVPVQAIPVDANRTVLPEAKKTVPPEPKITIVFKGKRKAITPEAERSIPTEDKITVIPKGKRTMAPEAERHVGESSCRKMKRVEPGYNSKGFMHKLKYRFRTIDTDVVGSFCKLMKRFLEGNISEVQLHRKVVDLIYYHDDLREEFSGFLRQTKNSLPTR